MNIFSRHLLKSLTLTIGLALVGGVCWADLDEGGFDSYSEGELLGQSDWEPQGTDSSGDYIKASDRAEVRSEPENRNVIIWLSGYPAEQQTRLAKSFSPVVGEKVSIRFDFLPGHTSVPGRLIFESGNGQDTLSLRFVKGTLQVLTSDDSNLVDTDLHFVPDEWNKIALECDLAKHEVTVLLNGKKSSPIALPEGLDQFQRMILFAGGIDFESGMDNLVIMSEAQK